MLKKLFKNTLIYAIGPQIPRVASIILLPFLTKFLTPYDYGVWALISVYTGLFSGLKILGMTQSMVNVFFKNDLTWKLHWRIIMGFLQTWSILFNLILCILLWYVLPNEIEFYKKLTILFCVAFGGIFFDTTIVFGFRYFQLNEKPMYITLITVTTGFISIFLNLYTITYLKLGFIGWSISSFVSGLITFSLLFYPLYFKEKIIPIFKYNWTILKQHLKIGLPTIPHEYSSYLLNASDRIVMDYYKVPTEQIGLYSFAYNFGTIAESGNEAFGMALGPVHSKLILNKEDNKVKYFITNLQVIFLLSFFVIGMWMKEIFGIIVSNKDLSSSYGLASLIIFSYSVRPLYWGAVNILGIHGKTGQLWKISLIAGIINLTLNFIFIPIYGYKAAIVNTFIGFLYVGVAGYFFNQFKQLTNQNYKPLIWVLFLSIAFIVLYWAVDFNPFIKLIISAILICFVVIKIKKLNTIL